MILKILEKFVKAYKANFFLSDLIIWDYIIDFIEPDWA